MVLMPNAYAEESPNPWGFIEINLASLLSPDEILQKISSGNFDESEINEGYITIRDASDEFLFFIRG